MECLHDLVRYVADKNDRVVGQDAGEDLGLPLVGKGFLRGEGKKTLQQRLGGGSRTHQLIEGISANTILALSRQDDDAAIPAGGLSGGHSLYRLVDVLVQGITVVAGQHDVRRLRGAAADSV